MLFYVEFDAGLQESHAQKVLQQLIKQGHKVSILGSYKGAAIPLPGKSTTSRIKQSELY